MIGRRVVEKLLIVVVDALARRESDVSLGVSPDVSLNVLAKW